MKTPFEPLAVCARMCEAAERGDWTELAALEESFASDIRHLLSVPPPVGREQERVTLMNEILRVYETLHTLSYAARQNLAHELRGLHRGQQARHAYKDCT